MRSFSALLLSIVVAFSWNTAEVAAQCGNGMKLKCFYDRCRCLLTRTTPVADTQNASGGMVAIPTSIWSSIPCPHLIFPPDIECLSRAK
ncbi:hypothetical protein AB6A40_005146 [Gnathostoma spinigerum]|uniref:Uncharacterized protein n=1 Tax=Gnathostoma spinigerum TaxID=75299 RepID=A0ABD6EP30_9BILA